MRKIWLVVMLVMLGILIYVLHVYVLITPDTDGMQNEFAQSEPDTAAPAASQMPESVTAQSLLNPDSDEAAVWLDEGDMVYERGLFSWQDDAYQPQNLSSYYLIINTLDIDEVYQDFNGTSADDQSAMAFARDLSLMDVDLYMLTGGSEWTYDDTGTPMLEEIERAAAFRNMWGDDALKGIVFDIEPYGSERWDADRNILMQNYVTGMKTAYNAAKDKGIRVILCVPTWYDEHEEEYFSQLVQCCDEISVMNYVREDEYSNMLGEVEYARAGGKDVTCIFEFQPAGTHDLTDANTYDNAGIDAAVASFENLYRDFSYPRLKLAFHYLKPIQELLQNEPTPVEQGVGTDESA